MFFLRVALFNWFLVKLDPMTLWSLAPSITVHFFFGKEYKYFYNLHSFCLFVLW